MYTAHFPPKAVAYLSLNEPAWYMPFKAVHSYLITTRLAPIKHTAPPFLPAVFARKLQLFSNTCAEHDACGQTKEVCQRLECILLG
jgi:hypothetical protein